MCFSDLFLFRPFYSSEGSTSNIWINSGKSISWPYVWKQLQESVSLCLSILHVPCSVYSVAILSDAAFTVKSVDHKRLKGVISLGSSIWGLNTGSRMAKLFVYYTVKTTWRDVGLCLTSGSHTGLAVWGGPIGHLSPSQSPSLAPSWFPSTPPQSIPPDPPRSATKYQENTFITSYALPLSN